MSTPEEISHRIEVLNESLKVFITAFDTRTDQASRLATQARIDDLCKTIVRLGGTITVELP